VVGIAATMSALPAIAEHQFVPKDVMTVCVCVDASARSAYIKPQQKSTPPSTSHGR